jgi:hypothetical protein
LCWNCGLFAIELFTPKDLESQKTNNEKLINHRAKGLKFAEENAVTPEKYTVTFNIMFKDMIL